MGRLSQRRRSLARANGRGLNEKVEIGIDPREALREEKARASMTVARAHERYMVAVSEGRASRAKRKNSPRTIRDKLAICKTVCPLSD